MSGTEPWQDLHVFHVEAQMDGSTEDDQENLASFTYFNVSEHKQNEIVKDDNPLPYDDDNFVVRPRIPRPILFLSSALRPSCFIQMTLFPIPAQMVFVASCRCQFQGSRKATSFCRMQTPALWNS